MNPGAFHALSYYVKIVCSTTVPFLKQQEERRSMARTSSQKLWLTAERNNAQRKKTLLREAWRTGYFATVTPVPNALSLAQLLSAPRGTRIIGYCLQHGKLCRIAGELAELSLTKDERLFSAFVVLKDETGKTYITIQSAVALVV